MHVLVYLDLDIVPVCNCEHGAVVELLPDGGLDQVVCLEVDRGRGLVQDQHLSLPQQGARQAHQLALAHTQILAALIHL